MLRRLWREAAEQDRANGYEEHPALAFLVFLLALIAISGCLVLIATSVNGLPQ